MGKHYVLALRVWMLAALLCGTARPCHAQIADSVRARDTLQRQAIRQDQLQRGGQDTARATRKAYAKAKQLTHKSKLLRALYAILLREPSNPLANEDEDLDKERNRKYRRYNRRIIRRVIIKPLDVFGPKVYDTLAETRNFAERLGNAVHATTRRRVVASLLSFKRGDRFASTLISNNERVLRQRGQLIDARILPIPTGYKDSVDVLVITQDVFSLGIEFNIPQVNADIYTDVRADVTESNLAGLGHRLGLTYRYYAYPGPGKSVNNYQISYQIPYLIRNTFISAEAEFIQFYTLHQRRVRVYRDFLFTDTKWAGSMEARQSDYDYNLIIPRADSVANFPTRLGRTTYDGWIGRAFKINSGQEAADDRVRIVVSTRFLADVYTERDSALRDFASQAFRNRMLGLFSVGYSDRDYFRDVLINGYGRTEDIPYGLSLTATIGMERNPQNSRRYAGIRYGQSKYFSRLGYFNITAEAGSYLDFTDPEQGLVRGELYYFSPLLHTGKLKFRHFVHLRYNHAYNRFVGETPLNIGSSRGITGVGSSYFTGTKTLALNLETVAFLNFDIFSFKAAPFATADFGYATFGNKIIEGLPYMGYGLGLRLFNERLTFNSIQLRLNYYPNIPDVTGPLRPNFSNGSLVRLPDFSINQPQLAGQAVGLDN